jgi:thiol-disulfide isomerase/thioredoxin
MKKIIPLMAFILVLSLAHNPMTGDRAGAGEQVVLHFFYGGECPHCKKLDPEIRDLAGRYKQLVVKKYEVWHNDANRRLFMSMAQKINKKAMGVPTVIIGDELYMGTNIGRIELLLKKYMKK